MNTDQKFNIQINGRKRHYPTLEAAKKVAQEIFAKTGVVVGIEKS
jgi:hypothetical protein